MKPMNHTSMQRRLTLAALVVTLFSALGSAVLPAFAAGAAGPGNPDERGGDHPPLPPPAPAVPRMNMEDLSKALNLDAGQRKSVETIVNNARLQHRASREENEVLRARTVAQLAGVLTSQQLARFVNLRDTPPPRPGNRPHEESNRPAPAGGGPRY